MITINVQTSCAHGAEAMVRSLNLMAASVLCRIWAQSVRIEHALIPFGYDIEYKHYVARHCIKALHSMYQSKACLY